MSEWISVEDRLPADGALVVASQFYEWILEIDAAVCWYIGNGEFRACDDALLAENYDGGATIQLDIKVTHWMPLPEPPSD